MYIYGTSTLSEIILDVAKSIEIKIDGFFDDFTNNTSFYGIPIIGGMECLIRLKDNTPNIELFVAVGDNENREMLFKKIESYNISLPNIIHPGACIESTAELGFGNLVMHGAYVGIKVTIGNGNLIFPCVCLTHHNIVGDYNFFSPNVSIGGYTKIKSRCKFGMNSVVKPHIEISNNYHCNPLTIVHA